MTINIRLGRISRLLGDPNWSACHRCKTTWKFVDLHDTFYLTGWGCFPLCEKCWTDLASPEERLPFYADLIFNTWDRPDVWPAVKAAVLEGK